MNTSFGQTHGDLLLSRVHKHNSLEYLQPMKGSRPGSAASRPRSAASSKGAGRSSRPASAVPKSMASAAPSYNSITSLRSSAVKTDLQKAIDGDTGPAMIGVASYPYSATQKNYLDDFEMLVAGTITHPYVCSTSSNKGSSPHNLLTGSNYAPTFDYFESESARTFKAKSYKDAVKIKAVGLRSEEMLSVG